MNVQYIYVRVRVIDHLPSSHSSSSIVTFINGMYIGMPFKYVKLSTEICSGVEKCVESNNLNVKGRMNDG
jgi:hypothetical protein